MAGTTGRRTISGAIETAVLIALPIVCHYLFPLVSIVRKPYTYLGIALMLLGLALSTWTSMTFRRAGASYQLKGESSVLMSSGPFRISRNPMYGGLTITRDVGFGYIRTPSFQPNFTNSIFRRSLVPTLCLVSAKTM